MPPIKIQGIKTKLVPFIEEFVRWDGKGTYFEPFTGSGVVGFNITPQRAVFSETNPYIIDFDRNIQIRIEIERFFTTNITKTCVTRIAMVPISIFVSHITRQWFSSQKSDFI